MPRDHNHSIKKTNPRNLYNKGGIDIVEIARYFFKEGHCLLTQVMTRIAYYLTSS